MNLRLALISFALCGTAYGCAAPEQTTGAQANEPPPVATYRTGSRLPSYDTDGSSSSGAVSKDDYNDQMNRSTSSGVKSN